MMYIIQLMLYMLLFTGCENVRIPSRKCFDCVSIQSCEPAFNLSQGPETPEARNLFRKAFCGIQNGIIKVCCSDFWCASLVTSSSSVSSDSSVSSVSSVTAPKAATVNVRITAATTHDNAILLPESCGDIDGSRIVGGRFAKLYEFPWMALISFKTVQGPMFFCAGSIINSRYILTAAHCVLNHELKEYKIAGVRVGEFDMSKNPDCLGDDEHTYCESYYQDIGVEEIVPHEDYFHDLKNADIALLRLDKTINMTLNNVAPICLPVTEEQRGLNLKGKYGTVAGWGVTDSGLDSSILMKVDIPIMTDAICGRSYFGYKVKEVSNMTFCAGMIGKDSCRGDSGGPLILEHEHNNVTRYIQYGVVSTGPRQCGTSFPGTYTNVSKFMKWILDKLRA